jgi:geranylgeranyl pyrophosphate synthase
MVRSSSPTSVVEGAQWSSPEDRAAIDAALAVICDRYARQLPAPVGEAVAYSLGGGGKRVRGHLLLAAYRAAGGRNDAAALAAAIEVVHAYSLVHDDLPCRHDQDVRRGRPTVHVRFGVAAGTAAGLTMVPWAATT